MSRRYLTQRHKGHREKHIKSLCPGICVRLPGLTAPDRTAGVRLSDFSRLCPLRIRYNQNK
ncbi:MAG: hypothetical protein DRI57_24595 [Deltaproteobacteria bacterium]|nr:MAG: hypothetical protein DRI57_24595 [Deltaproteobacteria bacterium]